MSRIPSPFLACLFCAATFAPSLAAPAETAADLVRRAMEDQRAGRLDQAASGYTAALALKPSSSQEALIHLNFGTIHSQRQQWEEAIRHYDAAIRLKPDFADAFSSRAATYKAQGKLADAVRDYMEAIRLAPYEVDNYIGLGNARGGGQHDWDGAIIAYSDAIRLDPKNSDAFNFRGYAHSSKGEWDKAIQDQNEAIRLQPGNAVAYVNRGEAYRGKSDLDAAIRDLTEAIKLDSSLGKAYNTRGVLYGSKGEWERSLRDFDEALRLEPDLDEALSNRGAARFRLGQVKSAMKDFAEALRINPKSAQAHKARAMAYLEAKDWGHFLPDLEDALRLDPSDLDACRSLTDIYRRCPETSLRSEEKSLRYARQACELTHWKDSESLLALSDAAEFAHRHDESMEALHKALVLPELPKTTRAQIEGRLQIYAPGGQAQDIPHIRAHALDLLVHGHIDEAIAGLNTELQTKRPPADAAQLHELLAKVHLGRRQWDQALAECDAALRLDPTLASAYGVKSAAHQGKGETALLIGDLTEELRFHPNDIGLHTNRGLFYQNQGKLAEALRDFEDVIRLDPKNAMGYNCRGVIYAIQGDLQSAVQNYDQALALNPNLAVTYNNRGFARTRLNQWDLALQDLDKSIQFDSSYAQAYSNRGEVHRHLGDLSAALRDHDQAIKLLPGKSNFHQLRAVVHGDKGEIDAAIRDLAEAIRLDPGNALAYKSMAAIALTQSRWGDAIRNSEEAIRLNPKYADAYKARGAAYLGQHIWDQAVRDLTKAVELNPNDDDTATELARIWATCPEASQRNGAKAIEMARQACELTRWTAWPPLDLLGAAHAETGHFEEAAQFARQALALKGLPDAVRQTLQAHLDLYGKHQPYHMDTVKQSLAKVESALDLLLRGAIAHAKGNFELAIACYREALTREHGLKEGEALYSNLAAAYHAANQDTKSIEACDEALRLYPSSAIALSCRGAAYLGIGDDKKAAQDLDAAIQIAPLEAVSHSERGAVWINTNEADKALHELSAAIRLFLQEPAAVVPEQENVEKSSVIHVDFNAISHSRNHASNLSIAYTRRGDAHSMKKEWDLAIHDYSDALRIQPTQATALSNRGNAYAQVQDAEHAMTDLDAAIKLDPKGSSSYSARAVLWMRRGEADKARRDLDQALLLDPQNVIALSNRMGYWAQQSDWAHTLADAQAAVRIDPENAYIWSRIAGILACADASLRNGPKALEAAQKACDLTHWKDADSLDSLAMAEAETGDFEKAIRHAKQALAMDGVPEDLVGRIRKRLGVYEEGKAYRLEKKGS